MKKSIKEMIARADAAKKVNPRDLSSDQDLTIGLMNLIAIENVAQGSQIAQLVQETRERLMVPMLTRIKSDAHACGQALDLLGQSVQNMQEAEKAQISGDFGRANQLYDMAYEFYVLYLATVYEISA